MLKYTLLDTYPRFGIVDNESNVIFILTPVENEKFMTVFSMIEMQKN